MLLDFFFSLYILWISAKKTALGTKNNGPNRESVIIAKPKYIEIDKIRPKVCDLHGGQVLLSSGVNVIEMSLLFL